MDTSAFAYLVTYDRDDGYEVERVYLDRAEAERFADTSNAMPDRAYGKYEIREFPIGAPSPGYDGPGYRFNWNCLLRYGVGDGSSPDHWKDEGPYEYELWINGDYSSPTVSIGRPNDKVYRQYFISAVGIDRDGTLKALRDAIDQVRAERKVSVRMDGLQQQNRQG